MKYKIEFTRMDLCQFHDLVFNALGLDLKTDDDIMKYWMILPNNIKNDFNRWGMGDTPTRDNAYVWLQENHI